MLALTKDGRDDVREQTLSRTPCRLEEMEEKRLRIGRETNVKVGKGPEGIDISPDEKEVWAANSGDGTVCGLLISGVEEGDGDGGCEDETLEPVEV